MAGDMISIPIVELRALGGELKLASQRTREVLDRLRSATQAVDPQWEGASKQRFFQEFRQWEVTMRQFSELLESVGARMESIAADMAQTDIDVARTIRR